MCHARPNKSLMSSLLRGIFVSFEVLDGARLISYAVPSGSQRNCEGRR